MVGSLSLALFQKAGKPMPYAVFKENLISIMYREQSTRNVTGGIEL